MASLTRLLDELGDAIRAAVEGLDVDVQVEPRMVVNPTPPTIDVYPGDPSRDDEIAGFDDLDGAKRFTVRCRVNTADADAGQDLLLAFMDEENTLSIVAAIYDDPTLGGYVASIDVRGGTGYVLYPTPDGTANYLGCQWTVTVIDVSS